MRRLAAGRDSTERLALTGYWLFSGYALRVWRALVAFACVLIIFTGLFTLWGFQGRPPTLIGVFADVAKLSVGFDDQSRPLALSVTGDLLEVLLRITGPVLLGLAVLSVRGRLKR